MSPSTTVFFLAQECVCIPFHLQDLNHSCSAFKTSTPLRHTKTHIQTSPYQTYAENSLRKSRELRMSASLNVPTAARRIRLFDNVAWRWAGPPLKAERWRKAGWYSKPQASRSNRWYHMPEPLDVWEVDRLNKGTGRADERKPQLEPVTYDA
jgi:hypothetical protein